MPEYFNEPLLEQSLYGIYHSLIDLKLTSGAPIDSCEDTKQWSTLPPPPKLGLNILISSNSLPGPLLENPKPGGYIVEFIIFSIILVHATSVEMLARGRSKI